MGMLREFRRLLLDHALRATPKDSCVVGVSKWTLAEPEIGQIVSVCLCHFFRVRFGDTEMQF